MRPVIILGGGGHARVILSILKRQGKLIIGIAYPQSHTSSVYLGVRILGDDQAVLGYSSEKVQLINGIGSLPGDSGLRSTIYEDFSARGYSFKTVIDSHAIIADGARLADGVQIMAGVIIQTGTEIAENTIVNSGAIVEHDCRIGKHTHIAPGALLCGNVCVGDKVHVGAGATIIQGMEIGSGSVIGAGGVVTKAVGCRQIVFPARGQQQDL
ncbi:MAG: acetyltransferase [Methylomonas sp.]